MVNTTVPDHQDRRYDMTVEEYLTDVDSIYYQLSTIVSGKQLLADGNNLLIAAEVPRLTDILDNRGKLTKVRFSTLILPPDTQIDNVGTDHCAINFGGVRLTIWPTTRR